MNPVTVPGSPHLCSHQQAAASQSFASAPHAAASLSDPCVGPKDPRSFGSLLALSLVGEPPHVRVAWKRREGTTCFSSTLKRTEKDIKKLYGGAAATKLKLLTHHSLFPFYMKIPSFLSL